MSGGRTRAERAIDSLWYGASPLRWTLWPLSLVFRSAAALRAYLYRRGLRRSVELPVPVVVVGNITAGGTGKTPLVIRLATQLKARGRTPGIVTRGYRGSATTWPQHVTGETAAELVGDEPVLLAARTGCPVVAGPDRVAAARALLEQGVDIVLSDDGLQHYRLARTFEIAVVDGTRGFGNGLCLPAGPLREPVARLGSVDAVVVNDSGLHRPALPRADAIRMTLEITGVYRIVDGATRALSDFGGRRVHAVAGIGHPERFFRALEHSGIEVLRHPLPDHARIRPDDLRPAPSAPVLVTEKDAVKCREIAHDDVWAVAVDAVLEPDGEARLLDAIMGLPARGERG